MSSTPTESTFEKTFGGTHWDAGRSVQQTRDGGYIIVGDTESFGQGEADVYLIKTDAKGKKLWERTFGGTKNDWGKSVQQTRDGGYIIVGYTESFGQGEADVYLIKTNAKGKKLWERTFGDTDWDAGFSVQQTRDGGYIIAGYTYSFGQGGTDVYLIKTNAKGKKLWERTFGGTKNDWGNSVQQTRDGGYIIVGETLSFGQGGRDVYLIKTDAKGKKLWERTFGGTDWDDGFSVQQTRDGGYIIVGVTDSFGQGEADVYLIKTDAEGNILKSEKSLREAPNPNIGKGFNRNRSISSLPDLTPSSEPLHHPRRR
ncbi:PQQ-like beta-propeller repeat protein [bacterium]|nr:PQQ-like beta-propeller repeat protein [bacterium]